MALLRKDWQERGHLSALHQLSTLDYVYSCFFVFSETMKEMGEMFNVQVSFTVRWEISVGPLRAASKVISKVLLSCCLAAAQGLT